MDDENVVEFTAITGASTTTATQYLQLADGSLEQAIEIFFANGGASLEQPARAAQPPPVPSDSTRPPGQQPPIHAAGDEVIDLDSDNEYQPPSDEDEIQVTRTNQRHGIGSLRAEGALHTPPVGTPPSGHTVDDDEAMARRLQEEIYGGGGAPPGDGRPEILDEHGYRAPIQRTTETLVGPEAFDPSNTEEMRAAVMEQMMARRQPRQPRGSIPYTVRYW